MIKYHKFFVQNINHKELQNFMTLFLKLVVLIVMKIVVPVFLVIIQMNAQVVI